MFLGSKDATEEFGLGSIYFWNTLVFLFHLAWSTTACLLIYRIARWAWTGH